MGIYPELLAKLPMVVLLIISGLGVVIGDYFAKSWSIEQKNLYLITAFLGYFSASFFYIPSLLKEGLVITSIIWSLFATLGFLFVGLIIFKETLTPLQIVGVSFGVIALLLLSIGH